MNVKRSRVELFEKIRRARRVDPSVSIHELARRDARARSVFVGWSLPRTVGVSEVDVDPGCCGELGVSGHFAALVPRQGSPQIFRFAFDDFDRRAEYLFGVMALGEIGLPEFGGTSDLGGVDGVE
jgi:hypothetical protein